MKTETMNEKTNKKTLFSYYDGENTRNENSAPLSTKDFKAIHPDTILSRCG